MASDERISDGGLKALLVVRSGTLPSPQLRGNLLGHLAGDRRTACRPKAIEFVRQLPATVDGGTGQRRLDASGDARARGSGMISEQGEQSAGMPPERRRDPRLRSMFEDAFVIIEPFLDPARGWTGQSLEHLAHRLIAQSFPRLEAEQVHALVVAVHRAYIERNPEKSGHLPRPDELHLVKL